MLVEDVLAHKLGRLELFHGERAQPFVLGQLLAVGGHKLFHLVVGVLEAEFGHLLVAELVGPQPRHQSVKLHLQPMK